MFFSISLSFPYHQQATNIKTNRVTLTKSWLLACVCQISGFITAGFCLSRDIPNCVPRTLPASESNNLYCKEIGRIKYLPEPESLSSQAVLWGLSILFVCCLHELQTHKYAEIKKGKKAFCWNISDLVETAAFLLHLSVETLDIIRGRTQTNTLGKQRNFGKKMLC